MHACPVRGFRNTVLRSDSVLPVRYACFDCPDDLGSRLQCVYHNIWIVMIEMKMEQLWIRNELRLPDCTVSWSRHEYSTVYHTADVGIVLAQWRHGKFCIGVVLHCMWLDASRMLLYELDLHLSWCICTALTNSSVTSFTPLQSAKFLLKSW